MSNASSTESSLVSRSRHRFDFQGTLPVSKSMLIRAMVLLSHEPTLWSQARQRLRTLSVAAGEDALLSFEGLERIIGAASFSDSKPLSADPIDIDCGAGGAPFRFLAVRASRERGRWRLTGTSRLLARPMEELISVLTQLGVSVVKEPSSSLVIESVGWRAPEPGVLSVSRDRSSQFLSAVLLNASGLDFDLQIHSPSEQRLSEPYAEMSLALLREWGLEAEGSVAQDRIRIPKGSRVERLSESSKTGAVEAIWSASLESDWSAAWSIAAHAVISPEGRACLSGLREQGSLQADAICVEVLRSLGARVQWRGSILEVAAPQQGVQGISLDLKSAPDLFPVLMALASLAQTASYFTGLQSLIHKESDRLGRMIEWVERFGGKVVRESESSIRVTPLSSSKLSALCSGVSIDFDPDHDHRLAMAASVWIQAGIPLKVTDPEVVRKSFPDFWNQISSAQREGTEK